MIVERIVAGLLLDRLQALIKAKEALLLLEAETSDSAFSVALNEAKTAIAGIIERCASDFDKAKADLGDDA